MDAPVVHFEIPAQNPEKLSGFYTGIFGWKIEKVPGMDYWMVNTKSTQEAPGINGGLLKKMHDNHVPTNYIDVKSVDDWSKKVTASGGTVAVPKSPVPGMGYFAVCLDPEGNCFGLWQNDQTAK
jgi:predicted enzyme related to lactoylglutathione lyase